MTGLPTRAEVWWSHKDKAWRITLVGGRLHCWRLFDVWSSRRTAVFEARECLQALGVFGSVRVLPKLAAPRGTGGMA